jgi:hypothetical protein
MPLTKRIAILFILPTTDKSKTEKLEKSINKFNFEIFYTKLIFFITNHPPKVPTLQNCKVGMVKAITLLAVFQAG